MKTFSRYLKRAPARYTTLAWLAAMFLAANMLVRFGLLLFEGTGENFLPWRLVPIFVVGAVYDLAALAYFLVPFVLLALLWPNNRWGKTGYAVSASILTGLALFGLLFTSVSEFIFWNEFSSRFNFIAVDYLIYTREVIGNIRESYPVGLILSAIAAIAAAIFFAVRKPFWRAASADGGGASRRLLLTSILCALPVLSFVFIDDGLHEKIGRPSARELAGNGYYEFMRAFRSNDLDYRAFYKTLSASVADVELRADLDGRGPDSQYEPGKNPLERKVTTRGPAKPYNIVLVSVESLGADYVESFGGKKGLTPNLDRLATQGLMFTQMYATGLRTVRGLEALTLSLPPTPGHAVPMRANNKGYQTFGGVLRERGYEALYLYGGYSYFDNMNDFFGGNGYTVIDRTAIARQNVTHENIWGVADEDLYRQAIREIDARANAGKKVFAHIMTTSNHRPFTYPDGRVDIPSGSGRDGAVKYTDWAIGEFIREASGKPWFKQTLFVFIADHTSHGRGQIELSPENYHIPMIVYAPGFVPTRKINTIASQIDVAPTVLAMLNVDYTSHFFGQDILSAGKRHQRAFMSNYLTVGTMEDGLVIELFPKQRVTVIDAHTGRRMNTLDSHAEHMVSEAVANYQVASNMLHAQDATHGPILTH